MDNHAKFQADTSNCNLHYLLQSRSVCSAIFVCIVMKKHTCIEQKYMWSSFIKRFVIIKLKQSKRPGKDLVLQPQAHSCKTLVETL